VWNLQQTSATPQEKLEPLGRGRLFYCLEAAGVAAEGAALMSGEVRRSLPSAQVFQQISIVPDIASRSFASRPSEGRRGGRDIGSGSGQVRERLSVEVIQSVMVVLPFSVRLWQGAARETVRNDVRWTWTVCYGQVELLEA
jgi:hypothetical protein